MPLSPWMTRLLWFVGGYNLLAGLSMVLFYHEGYKLLGLAKPQVVLPIQIVGVLVGLFGIGYWMVARNPLGNRNVLLLGFLSKGLGSALGVYHIAAGNMPLVFLPVLFLADIVYLPPFALMLRRLYARPADSAASAADETAKQQPRAA